VKGGWQFAAVGTLVLMAVLAPVKFGVPVVLQSAVTPPADGWEWLYFAWPNALLVMFGFLVLPGLAAGRLRLWLPAIWLGTQVVALLGSVYWQVSADTVLHFTVCVLVLLVAAQCDREVATKWVAGGLAVAALITCMSALSQHFGGLAATREYADQLGQTTGALAKRLASGRVFGTFVYPNALAGFLVVAFGPVVALLWKQSRWTAIVGAAVMGWVLVLTGSRGGVVAMAAAVAVGALLLARTRRQRVIGVAAIGLFGLLGAWVAGSRGAASFEARLDYWRGAVEIIKDYPSWGTGPGTFGSMYPAYKAVPTEEEAEMAHNAYLQMWSDSGVFAFLAYLALWGAGLVKAVRQGRGADPLSVGLAAGLVGWVVHQGVDFDLHVPGVAVPAFLLLGLVCSERQEGEPSTKVSGLRWVAAVLALPIVFWAGRQLVAGGRLAAGDVEGAVRYAPRNADYWTVGGMKALEGGAPKLAIRAFSQAARLDQCRAVRHWHLALALAEAHGWIPRAVGELREAVRLNPTKQRYREALAEIEEKLRQPGDGLLLSAPKARQSSD